MAKVVTLGEIMLRLSPPGNQRFLQAQSFDVNYGGGEANVAVTLAQLGHRASFVSKIPDNAIGEAAIATLRKMGVDCTHIVRGGERLGIYYLENGASIRPSSVVYDRAGSAIACADPKEFDFDAIFENVDLFHISGITVALSDSAAKLAMVSVEEAAKRGITISFDLNYRAKLWTDKIAEKQKAMAQIAQKADICFGNALDAEKCLGYRDGHYHFTEEPYENSISPKAMADVVHAYGLKCLVTTLRENHSASDNGWSGAVSDGSSYFMGRKYELHIVDRVGGGDAYAAGFLHGWLSGKNLQESLELGLATAAIKHTIPGDLNFVTEAEVERLAAGDGAGRVIR